MTQHSDDPPERKQQPGAGTGPGDRVDGESDSGQRPVMVPSRIGNYRIRSVIGTGGMGTVFKAEHVNSGQIAALKLMRAGMSSTSAVRRFEREARFLGRLSHPGIARIFDAGTHQDGLLAVPYFAMEYLHGARSLTAFAEAEGLSTRKRLELFVKVCEAVHHGHEKGVIHRDLKPENILVDDGGEPKVIDFGVARAADHEVTMSTMMTETGQLVGTVRYMSPEQTDMSSRSLDRCSDVYSLGVVLYQLLTRKLPYELGDDEPPVEVMRIIKERSPTRLSVVDTSLRGDVETIVHKALEKDPKRRYQTAAELAEDIQRFLRREPIRARPPSLAYQLGVFARRNRGLVAAVTAIFIAAVAAAVVSTTFAVRASRERDRARLAERRAEAVSSFLSAMVRSANPMEPWQSSELAHRDEAEVTYAAPPGQAATMVDVLRNAAARLDRDDGSDTQVEAELRVTIGRTLAANGEPDEGEIQVRRAVALLERLVGPDHPQTLEAEHALADIFGYQGRFAEMRDTSRDLFERAETVLGPAHPRTLEYAEQLGRALFETGEAEQRLELLRRTSQEAFRQRGEHDPVALEHSLHLARALVDRGLGEEALPIARAAREGVARAHGADSLEYAEASRELGRVLRRMGHYAEAEEPLRTALELYFELYGEDHPATVLLRENLAAALDGFGQVEEALALNRRGLELCYRYYGHQHPLTLRMENSVAWNLATLGRELEEGERLARHALDGTRALVDGETTSTLDFRDTLAWVVMRRGRLEAAEALYRRNLELAEQVVDDGDWYLVVYQQPLAHCLLEAGKMDQAEAVLLDAMKRLENTIGQDSDPARGVIAELVKLYGAWHRPEAARRWSERLQSLA